MLKKPTKSLGEREKGRERDIEERERGEKIFGIKVGEKDENIFFNSGTESIRIKC